MFRTSLSRILLSRSKPLTPTLTPLRSYHDQTTASSSTPNPSSSSTRTSATPDTPDTGSPDTGPHADTGPVGPTRIHATRKNHNLNTQEDNVQKGFQARSEAEHDADNLSAQSGAGEGGRRDAVNWDEEFPSKPKGPVIGMQDERGGITGRGTSGHGGLTEGEGRKESLGEAPMDRTARQPKQLHDGRLVDEAPK